MISKENIWILLDRNFKLIVKNELYNDAYNLKLEELKKINLKMLYTIFKNILYYHLIRVIKIKYVIENKPTPTKKTPFSLKTKANKHEE